MDTAAERGLLWDTGDDRSRVFAPVADAAPPAARARPLVLALAPRAAANEEPVAAVAVLVGRALRAVG